MYVTYEDFYRRSTELALDKLNRFLDLNTALISLTGHDLEHLVYELKNGATIMYPDKRTTKPPLGVMPRDIWNRKRQKELADAMQRYLEAGKSIPREWIDEYNELSDREEV